MPGVRSIGRVIAKTDWHAAYQAGRAPRARVATGKSKAADYFGGKARFARDNSLRNRGRAFLSQNRRKIAVGAGAVGLYGLTAPGSNRSRSNQNDRALRRIRAHQANQLANLQGTMDLSSGSIRPRSSGGYTL